jgi:hypothetical protein
MKLYGFSNIINSTNIFEDLHIFRIVTKIKNFFLCRKSHFLNNLFEWHQLMNGNTIWYNSFLD